MTTRRDVMIGGAALAAVSAMPAFAADRPKSPLGVAALQVADRDAVRNFRQHGFTGRETPPLRARHAVEVPPGAGFRQHLTGIVVGRQMQCYQRRDNGRRQILGKVMAMAVHEVDRILPQNLFDPLPVSALRPAPEVFAELLRKRLGSNQLTSRFGAYTGDDQRSVALRNQCSVERRKHLFRAPGGVASHGCKNVSDTENCQTHQDERPPSTSSARRV